MQPLSRRMSRYERVLDRVMAALERHLDKIERRGWEKAERKQHNALTQRISAYTS